MVDWRCKGERAGQLASQIGAEVVDVDRVGEERVDARHVARGVRAAERGRELAGD